MGQVLFGRRGLIIPTKSGFTASGFEMLPTADFGFCGFGFGVGVGNAIALLAQKRR